jgi:hypothetical protein
MLDKELTAEQQSAADALLLWFGQQWAPNEEDRMAFLTTFFRVVGGKRCAAALEAWNLDPDLGILDVPTLEAIFGEPVAS